MQSVHKLMTNLAAEFVGASVALDRQEVELVAVGLEAVGTELRKLHFETL
jgi:hypothetical protein